MKTTVLMTLSLMIAGIAFVPNASAVACNIDSTPTFNEIQECEHDIEDAAQEAAGTVTALVDETVESVKGAVIGAVCGFLETCD